MRRITYDMLHWAGACEERNKFVEIFCEGEDRWSCSVYPTRARVITALEAGLDVAWFIEQFFSPIQLSIYKNRIAAAQQTFHEKADRLPYQARTMKEYDEGLAVLQVPYYEAIANAFITAWSVG